jgi:hypothetical protein
MLQLFPNPTKDVIEVVSSITIDKIVVYDMLGKEIQRVSNINNKNHKLILDSKCRGVYYISIHQTNNNILSKKIVIE